MHGVFNAGVAVRLGGRCVARIIVFLASYTADIFDNAWCVVQLGANSKGRCEATVNVINTHADYDGAPTIGCMGKGNRGEKVNRKLPAGVCKGHPPCRRVLCLCLNHLANMVRPFTGSYTLLNRCTCGILLSMLWMVGWLL